MRRIFKAYKELLGILFSESPFIVIATFLSAVLAGLAMPISAWTNGQIFNLGILVASGDMEFLPYIPYLVLFVVAALLPGIMELFTDAYIEPRSLLVFRTAFKGKMLQKLKKMRYEHLECEESMEIIDKAYNRAESSARHMFPMYVNNTVVSFVSSIGIIYLFASARWWLVLTVTIPFLIEFYFKKGINFNIYKELEKYWEKERSYTTLGNMLKSRDYIQENRLFQSSDYLIDTYRNRLSKRNREYEKYYFKHLKMNLTSQYITRAAQIGNALLLLMLYINGQLNIGMLISLTVVLFSTVYNWNGLYGCTLIITASGYHINFFEFYDKYFNLSEGKFGDINEMPKDFSIEFDNVYFKYPNTDKQILNGLTFTAGHGEKISVVGENGEGKTTIIKLLLGLFEPDRGEIRIGGKPLSSYSQEVKSKLFGPVFQDFNKYSITLRENIGVGEIEQMNDEQAIENAMQKAKVNCFAAKLPNGAETLLGRDFEGGVDLSGGQWQRIAIARAFMGDKPILILDEPTSQLDPMAESKIYTEFAEMSEGKTSIFITHRLGSTMITDRILVISGGRIAQSGSHEELMKREGIYSDMFNSQKQWYLL